ncbi:hypothetical protein [Vibrio sp. TBV020]|uniref:hypothetical protein n=1 Tax=Vibrio sp. TBV020 TaxID=3137398 RepID=UPI0038CD3E96
MVKHNKQFKQIRNAWYFGFESASVFTAQWFGLVWFGLVWFGLVWFGLVGSVAHYLIGR